MNIIWARIQRNETLLQNNPSKIMELNNKTMSNKWFVHLIRLTHSTPAKIAFRYFHKDTDKPQNQQRITWKLMMEKNLSEYSLNWHLAI